tara:strand:+ start:950 stop:2242 length:1293 start_codon:yes stop_codon:yes gene_type:complete
MKFIKKTTSICHICKRDISARIYEDEGKMFIKKVCPAHGSFTFLHRFDSPQMYYFFQGLDMQGYSPAGVFLELTKKCNLNCNYCYNDSRADRTGEDLDITKLPNLDKFKNIYLTGGEPTCRKDLFKVINYFKKQGKRVFILTNGLKLVSSEYVKKLKIAGIYAVILSFDSFNDDTYRYMKGKPLLAIKKKAIMNLKDSQIATFLINCVVDKVNLKEINLFLNLLSENKIIRGLIFVPAMSLGRYRQAFSPKTSKLFEAFDQQLGIQLKDFFQSTELIVNVLNLFSKYIQNKRYFSKCFLYCLALEHKVSLIPINNIFDVDLINKKIKRIKNESKWEVFRFFIFFLFHQNFVNFFKNRNYRIFFIKIIRRWRFIFSGNLTLLNPFISLMFHRVQLFENYDTEYNKFCGRVYYDQKNNKFELCCKMCNKFND